MIVFNWGGELKVTEYSLTQDLNLDKSKKIYYDGLVSYYEIDKTNSENSSIKLLTDNLYKAPEVDYDKSLNKINNRRTKIASANTSEQLDYTLDYICQNTLSSSNTTVNGIKYDPKTLCTQTSSAMLIQYYDKHWSGYGNIASNSGGALVHSILSYMIPDNGSGSTSLECFKNKLSEYIRSKGFSATISYQTSTATSSGQVTSSINVNYPNTILQDIRNERPGIIIVGKNADVESGSRPVSDPNTLHAMTIYGIKFTSDDVYISVNDPYNTSGSVTRRNILWDTYPYPGEPSAVYGVARVVISK